MKEKIDPPCEACPPAMRIYCTNLWDAYEVAKLNQTEKEEFSYAIIEEQTNNLGIVQSCSINNVSCPINDDYLDWVFCYSAVLKNGTLQPSS